MARSKAFITGATSGFGLATARLFASRGWDLVITARREAELRSVADELSSAHRIRATPLAFDVRDLAALRRLEKEQPQAFEDVDVLVNNAGLALGDEVLQAGNPEEWDVVIDTNVKGLLYVTRTLLPKMIQRGKGHVVNVGSTAGHWVYKGGAVYNASKFAVRAINEALRHDLNGTGIRVSSVDPGFVRTNFSNVRYRGDAAKAAKVYEGFTPLAAEDVAEAIWWVVSRPGHVNIQQIIMMPTDQAAVGVVHRRPG